MKNKRSSLAVKFPSVMAERRQTFIQLKVLTEKFLKGGGAVI